MGRDTLLGGPGNDDLTGLDGTTRPMMLVDDDVIDGGPGRDEAEFRGSPDFLSGGLFCGIITSEGFDRISSVEEQCCAPNHAMRASAAPRAKALPLFCGLG